MDEDVTDPQTTVDLDDLTDEQVMERCRRARGDARQMEIVRGLDMMGAKRWDENAKLAAFMHVFHPERAPRTMNAARKLRGET